LRIAILQFTVVRVCDVIQGERLQHVDSVGCMQVLAATHSLYLSLQVLTHDNLFSPLSMLAKRAVCSTSSLRCQWVYLTSLLVRLSPSLMNVWASCPMFITIVFFYLGCMLVNWGRLLILGHYSGQHCKAVHCSALISTWFCFATVY